MLSDAGSKVIRAFGILNTNVPEDHKMMYGMPWPGDYLLAPDGTVIDKLFLRNYEHRASASQIAVRHYNDAGGNSVEIETNALSARVSLSADKCFPGQELAIGLEINLKPGWHIYGKPLPTNYQATELTFESPIVSEYSLELPLAQPLLLKALNETLPVYQGAVRGIGKLAIKWSPPSPAPFLKPLGDMIKPGTHVIDGSLRFQACNDEICEMPQSLKFQLSLQIQAGIPPVSKTAQ
jgi:hypothetical protein